MNLCNSGLASCYTGRSVDKAAEVLRAEAPDVVMLNEVCEGDVPRLHQALAQSRRDATFVWAFQAAIDPRIAAPWRCLNGQAYGIGLIAKLSNPKREHVTSGIYPMQDTGDPEDRVWTCLHAVAAFYACTTHLVSTNGSIALAQCEYLSETTIPGLWRHESYEPTVIGGDFNLTSSQVRDCLPRGFATVGDGALQHLAVTSEFTIVSHRVIDMGATTDHNALLVDLRWP